MNKSDYEILIGSLRENAESNGLGDVFKSMLRNLVILPLSTPRGYVDK